MRAPEIPFFIREFGDHQVLRSSDFYTQMGIHPRFFADFNDPQSVTPVDTTELIKIESKLSENLDLSSGAGQGPVHMVLGQFKVLLKNSIVRKITKDDRVVYETLDLQSDDLFALLGAETFMSNPEVNPPLGFFGLDALVNDSKLESEAEAQKGDVFFSCQADYLDLAFCATGSKSAGDYYTIHIIQKRDVLQIRCFHPFEVDSATQVR